MSRAVMVAVLVGACAPPAHAPALAVAQAPGGQPRARDPARAVIPQNASRITARVIKQTTYPPGTLAAPPAVAPDVTYQSVTLEVLSASAARDGVPSLAQGTLEAFTHEALPALAGRRVEAVVRLTGDNFGSRWILVEIRPIEP